MTSSVPTPNPTPKEDLAEGVRKLRQAAETAALRLSGDAVDSDIQDLAEDLAGLEEMCEEVARGARGTWKTRLNAARKHIHEARDLLDDGEPADAVALEVMAAREGLRN